MAEVEIGLGQVGTSGLRVRRHRHRAQPPDPGPRGRRHLLGDRRLPLRAAAHGARPWTGSSARPRPSRSAASAASACSTSRASGPATRTPTPLLEEIAELDTEKATQRMQDIYQEPIKPELIGQRIREINDAGVVSCASVTPQRTAAFAPPRARGRARPAGHPGHGRVGRARLQDGRAAEPQAVRPRARHAGHRRRLRQLPGRAAPHAHRRRRRARRRRPRSRLHHPRRARHRRPPGHRHRRRPGRPHAPPRRDRRLRPRHRRRRHGHRWRHRQGHRLRRRRRHDRLAAGRRPRGARPGLPLGHGHLPPDAAPRRPGQDDHPGHPRRRSWSARPTRTTAA